MNRLQVLLPPPGRKAFGGVGTFDGLGADNEKELFEICDFEYMGDSDYEMGVLPDVMYHIAESRPAYQLYKTRIRKKMFYVLIEKTRLINYIKNIHNWISSNYGIGFHYLADVVEGKEDLIKTHLGWIDIDAKTMFFVDEEMARKLDKWLNVE